MSFLAACICFVLDMQTHMLEKHTESSLTHFTPSGAGGLTWQVWALAKLLI